MSMVESSSLPLLKDVSEKLGIPSGEMDSMTQTPRLLISAAYDFDGGVTVAAGVGEVETGSPASMVMAPPLSTLLDCDKGMFSSLL
jgi:hypothetical protein